MWADKISVVIVDDHSIVIEGIKSLLLLDQRLNITGHFTTGKTAYNFIERERPHVVLLDINLPDINGIDLCREIKTVAPEIKILALSNHAERNIIMQILQSGANGYMLKNVSQQELLKGISAVVKGDIYFSNEVREIIAKPAKSELKGVPRLTKREKQVLVLIAEGKTTQEIATQLNVSPLTIETHRRNLHFKFQVKNVAELIMAATRCQLL
ncbi:response regulator [Sinomicrobium weinanense]|uniref:Response regulator transcription factor n=1 Tax=Sinomicrobium weinanense TaxID=2842200 RepID=A0A926Q0S8_9FLAO|nr:response regulator transcription factor [Sinomicrobium weinanense]MBC9795202.1 response regulator transcription factor [Sinomicrobium weinanense]MBU3121979.1 response regulator transcription factor [Sinomicrobium weinanense]